MRVLHSNAWESRNCLQYPVAAALSYQVSGEGLSIDPTSFCPFLFSPFSFFVIVLWTSYFMSSLEGRLLSAYKLNGRLFALGF